MSVCLKCGNYGVPGGCPECGIDSENKLDLNTIPSMEKFVNKCEFNLIPHKYIGNEWKREYLEVEHEKFCNIPQFKRFINSCEKLHNSFKNGNPINKSVYLFAPPRFGKEYLAFSCMQLALNSGLNVAPYLDTVELKRLLILGGENPSYKLYGRINYDKYMTSDIVFVTVTQTTFLKEAYTVLLELISRRSRLNLPTYIISELTLDELTANANKYVGSKWSEVSTLGINDLKYPVVIGFRPNDYK